MILPKVGIIACSGIDLPEGTVTRLAALKVLDDLRPKQTVTICLPLFLAGGKEDREFVKNHPTIVVDGCDKRCGERSVKQLQGKLVASTLVPDLIEESGLRPKSADEIGEPGDKLVQLLAKRIVDEVDRVFEGMKKKKLK
ncbi:MAG: putative zinc-binding protein [Candidatus Lokiarchaeia archaeon]